MGPTRLSNLAFACLLLCFGTVGFIVRSHSMIDTLHYGNLNICALDGELAFVHSPVPADGLTWTSTPRPSGAAQFDWPVLSYHPAGIDPVTHRATAAGFILPLWLLTLILVLPPLLYSQHQQRKCLRGD